MLLAKSGGGGAADKLYVDDVFSTYLYTGNDSTQTITNGIDLAGEGGLVWCKSRLSADSHRLFDTDRGVQNFLSSNTTGPNNASGVLTSFNSNGFTLGGGGDTNNNADNYASWTFSRAPKFFDIVTYTGNGVSGRQIAHSLGVAPGMVIIKSTSNVASWIVWHRSLAANRHLSLNQTNAEINSGAAWAATSTTFSIPGGYPESNASGYTYVAYLFAHDTATDGMIQCGSFTTDGSGKATVDTGWTSGSQYIMLKASSIAGDWEIYDTARTSAWSGNDARLRSNLLNAEDAISRLSASGSSVSFTGLSASQTYIYLTIAAPEA